MSGFAPERYPYLGCRCRRSVVFAIALSVLLSGIAGRQVHAVDVHPWADGIVEVDVDGDGVADTGRELVIESGTSRSYRIRLSKEPRNLDQSEAELWWVKLAVSNCPEFPNGYCKDGDDIVIEWIPTLGRTFGKNDWSDWKDFRIDARKDKPGTEFVFSHHVWDDDANCPVEGSGEVSVSAVGAGSGSGTSGSGSGSGSSGSVSNRDRNDYRAPPTLAIGDTAAHEGGTAEFVVSLLPWSPQPVTVDFKTEGGTAVAGLNYKLADGKLIFAPGNTRKTIRVPILKDSVEEETEAFKVTLSNVSGGARLVDDKAVAVGKIIGDMERRIEFVNRTILPDIGRALAFAPTRCRLDRAFSGLAADREARFGRVSLSLVPGSLPPGSLRRTATDAVSPTSEQALREWSFLVPSAEGSGGAERVTAWGCGDYLRLDGGGEDGVVSWDGEVVSVEFGADVSLGPSVLAGVSVSRSTGSFDYHAGGRGEGASGEHDLRLTGVHPYLGWSVSPSLDVWGTVGRASGEFRISDNIARRSVTRSVTVNSGAVGVIGRLPVRGATKFKLRGEAGLARLDLEGAEAAIGAVKLGLQRLRFSTEASHEYELSSGASLTPREEMGLRYDGGDGESGAGLEFGTGVRHRNPDTGWTTEGYSRWLAVHEDSSLREWGFGAAGASRSGAVRPRPVGEPEAELGRYRERCAAAVGSWRDAPDTG